jgi:cyclophilin family peptidyl-prolyl cis-trans isomerase
MIQGGGFTPDMKQKPTRAPIPLEAKQRPEERRGHVAMARTSDPIRRPRSSSSTSSTTPSSTTERADGHGYAVFGKVVSGHGRGRQDPPRCPRATRARTRTCRHAGGHQVGGVTPRRRNEKMVRLHTSAARSRIELDDEKAPGQTVANFLDYVRAATTTARSSTA